jgi:hypothetical protein
MKPRTGEKILTAAVLAHLAIAVVHGVAHVRAHVLLSKGAMSFVVLVIFIGPIFGLVVQRLALVSAGQWVIAATLAGALVFGMSNHFLMAGADRVSHVVEAWRVLFGITAGLLAATEAYGSALAVWCAMRRGSRS